METMLNLKFRMFSVMIILIGFCLVNLAVTDSGPALLRRKRSTYLGMTVPAQNGCLLTLLNLCYIRAFYNFPHCPSWCNSVASSLKATFNLPAYCPYDNYQRTEAWCIANMKSNVCQICKNQNVLCCGTCARSKTADFIKKNRISC